MNLYRAIRNCSAYWFARLILEYDNHGAQALSSGIHVAERKAIVRMTQRRWYWRLRAKGLSGSEAAAKMWGIPVSDYRARTASRNRKRAQRFGGWPTQGTTAYNRYILTK